MDEWMNGLVVFLIGLCDFVDGFVALLCFALLY